MTNSIIRKEFKQTYPSVEEEYIHLLWKNLGHKKRLNILTIEFITMCASLPSLDDDMFYTLPFDPDTIKEMVSDDLILKVITSLKNAKDKGLDNRAAVSKNDIRAMYQYCIIAAKEKNDYKTVGDITEKLAKFENLHNPEKIEHSFRIPEKIVIDKE